MFKNLFRTKNKKTVTGNNTLVAALLIHAAKIDENYTDVEKSIIKRALMDLNKITPIEAENLLMAAEEKEKNNSNNKNVLIIALLIHAAKIDENYTENEKKIIKKVIMDLNKISSNQADELLRVAEKKEKESNQLIEFTKEIKKYSMEFKLKIVEIIWKIVYSDGTSDDYESNLIRRICGLLYVSDKDNGIIKTKVQNLLK